MSSGPQEVQRVTFNHLQGCLVGTIQADLDARMLERFRSDLLEVLEKERSSWLVLDCAGVEVLDVADFEEMRRIISMANLMGTRTVVAGLRPGVVSSLIQLDADVSGIETALTLAIALDRLNATERNSEEDSDDAELQSESE